MNSQLIPQDKIVKVRRAYAEICSLSNGVLEKAIKLGAMLNELRVPVPHGEWLPWIEQNIPEIQERMVQRYIQLWENRETIREHFQMRIDGDAFAELPTIKDALALIQKPRATPVKRPAQQVKEKRSRRTREVEATVTPAATPEPGSSDGLPAERPEKIAESEPDGVSEPDDQAENITVKRCPNCGEPLV